MSYYRDLREHIKALEERGKLIRVRRRINKDTELMPLVRWQFRGLSEEERKAFLFEDVTDAKGRDYRYKVLVCALAASREVYAIGMNCKIEEITERWTKGQLNPIEPKLVSNGLCQEEVHTGERLLEHGGLDEFPIPLSTPGFGGRPRTTASHWMTRDPDTGIRNVGNYSGMVKTNRMVSATFNEAQDIYHHWQKCRERGIPLEAALVVGVVPAVAYTAVGKIPYGVDELAVSGGIAGEAIEVVRCKTVDMEVPATAELVIEGRFLTEYLIKGSPFGEYTGYMKERDIEFPFEVSCIMHRRGMIFQALMSQFPPSESSKIRQIAYEHNIYKFLRYECGISGVMKVAFHEMSGSWQYCVIQMKKRHPSQPWQALNGAVAYSPTIGKFIIVVDEDIDPHDADSVNWALSFRVQPHRDTRITMGKASALDHSSAPPWKTRPEKHFPGVQGNSALLIDATRKWDYPPTALPRREYMEGAKEIWEELGLPKLRPKEPWYGYNLGYWSKEDEEDAELAVRGDSHISGERQLKNKLSL